MYVQTVNDNIDTVATFAGWQAPNYANNWNDVIQIVYARSNYNENSRLGNKTQREYVDKTQVGSVIDAYRKTRASRSTNGYNPSDADSFKATVSAVERQLGRFAPPNDKVRLILRNFYYGVFGSPQQIPASWYTAGSDYSTLTESQKQALRANAEDATTQNAEECGIFCSIKKTVSNLFALPGNVASGVSTSARIMSIAVPVVVVGGTVWVLWVLGRKVLELDSTETASTIGTRGLNKLAQ